MAKLDGTTKVSRDFEADIAAIHRIDAVPVILDVICRTTGMGFAAVARVTSDRWIACAVRDAMAFGLEPGGELPVESTICHEVMRKQAAIFIDHVGASAAYRDHPTPALYGFESYVSVPIVLPDGTFFGTLCAIDPKPARVSEPQTLGMFKLFADLIAFHMDAKERLAFNEASLSDLSRTSELREQFIAVLGHDLRNPLASIQAGVRLISKTPLSDKAATYVAMMQGSVARMSGLIDNVLDFARGRLSGGFTLTRRADVALGQVVEEVIGELQAAWPDRQIVTDLDLPSTVNCDRVRIGQIVSNLVANALVHGAKNEAVRLKATTNDQGLEIVVANGGDPIPAEAMEHLFQPFARGAIKPGDQGLGLGLYIACEIARAHGGTLHVESAAKETSFTFRMPLS